MSQVASELDSVEADIIMTNASQILNPIHPHVVFTPVVQQNQELKEHTYNTKSSYVAAIS